MKTMVADRVAGGGNLMRWSQWALVIFIATAALQALPSFAQTDSAGAAPAQKVLRLSFPTAETGFDPAQVNDLYSRTVTPHLFEGLYQYDHLARPAKIRSLTAEGMPQEASRSGCRVGSCS